MDAKKTGTEISENIYEFSILLLFNNEENAVKTVSNLIENNNFSKIELILIDNALNLQEEFIINESNSSQLEELIKNHSNIIYVNARGKSQAVAYNMGLQIATGKYFSFIEEDVKYEKNAIREVEKHIKKDEAKLLALRPIFNQPEKLKPYKMSPKKQEMVDLTFNPKKLNLALDSYFIHKNLIKTFDETINFEDAKFKFLLNILIDYPFFYAVTKKAMYYTNPKEDDVASCAMEHKKEWYNSSIKNFVLPYVTNIYETRREIKTYMQEAILYYVFAKYNCNINDRNKMVLNSDEAKEFFESTSEVLKFIDTNLFFKKLKEFKIPRWLAFQFTLAKNKKLNYKTNVEVKEDHVCINSISNEEEQSVILREVEKETVNIYAINAVGKSLEIDFNISMQDFLNKEDVTAFVKYNNKIIEAEKTNCYSLLKVFGLTVSRQIPFHVTVPLENENSKIEFYFKYKNNEYLLKTKFEKIQAHLNNSKYSYWKFNEKYYLENKEHYLQIRQKTLFSGIKKELTYFLARMLRTKHKMFTLKYFGLRFIYFLVKPFYKNKQVWVSYDKLYKAGDNGEYIYEYIKNNHPKIKMYYIIKKGCADYNRLKLEPNAKILTYGSFKHKLISLLSTVAFSTHANVASYCSFDTKKSRMCVCDLFNPEVICIQHGLTIQKIAQYQNRLVDNVRLYGCVSKYEVENLLHDGIYGYNEKQLKYTGLARYDGLKNKEKRQILITPTWRKYLALPSQGYGKARKHSDDFKNTVYFKIYNTLINNPKMIETAKKCGYKIVYLLHPCTSAQINDYDKNDAVELIAATDEMNYEKILTESSLMVTDYSGVQFDFAYMRKPIVYYHPDELPPHYEAGGLNYETMGFGPICKTNEEVVNELCEYMENDCKTKQEYINRANEFFAFNDFNNCERIYNEVMNYLKNKNEKTVAKKERTRRIIEPEINIQFVMSPNYKQPEEKINDKENEKVTSKSENGKKSEESEEMKV